MSKSELIGEGIGIVVIGRNEGERLKKCLESISSLAAVVVYVDSGSTDNSVLMARERGASVVELDMSIPFTAARARNEGFRHLCSMGIKPEFVQFVDGDCEIMQGWLEQASLFLKDHPDVAAVCGRTRERYPQASVYNMLCDIEWDAPIGEAEACGSYQDCVAALRAGKRPDYNGQSGPINFDSNGDVTAAAYMVYTYGADNNAKMTGSETARSMGS